MMQKYGSGISVSKHGAVWTVTMSNLHKRNAVNQPTAKALVLVFTDFENDDSASVAVLYGEGGFCAGADLKAVAAGQRGEANRMAPVGQGPGPMGPTRMLLSKPVIAAVSGHAVAGGLELAAWCDMRIAETDAIFGVYCRRWGVPLVDGGTVRLPRLIGMSNALDMILTGRGVSAEEALRMGLANRVVPKGQALRVAQEIAASIASFPQACMKADRMSAYQQHGLSITDALTHEFNRGIEKSVLQDIRSGAGRFASGSGRHGSFEEFRDIRSSSSSQYKCVIFDIGGVVSDSPVHIIAEYEKTLPGYIPGQKPSLNMVFFNSESFQKLERGEYQTPADFAPPFEKECLKYGYKIDANSLFERMGSVAPRTVMVHAIHKLRHHGFKIGAITNNWKRKDATTNTKRFSEDLFDVVIESSVVGIRKPNPEIYKLACKELDIKDLRDVIFLDDIGYNLKPAKAMGMTTIKVVDAESALKELSNLVDIDLISQSHTSKL